MVYLAWLVILLIPYWLGPIVVWVTQRAGARPAFEPFTLGRHAVPEDVAAAFRQTCDALTTEGFHVVADLFQSGHNEARQHPCRDGRTVSIHNSPVPGSFTPPPSRVVVRLPIVRDPARLCRIKRAYLARHYRGVERVPSSSSSRGSGRRGSARRGRCLPTSWRLPLSPTRSARSSGSRAAWPPLVGTDSVGDSLVTEGFAVSVPAAWAERLVAMAQPRFLEQGFYLFRAEQHFGIGRRSDRVALFPRSDR